MSGLLPVMYHPVKRLFPQYGYGFVIHGECHIRQTSTSNVYVLRGSSFFSLCLSHTSKFFVTSRIPLDLPNTHQRTPSQRRVGATQDRTKLRTYLGDNELHDAEAFYCDVRNPFWLPKHKRVGHADHRPSHVHAVPQLKPMRIVSAFRFRGWEIKNG